MKTKAELFKAATDKNALRRQAQLPLLNIREEMEMLAYQDQVKAYNEVWEANRSVLLQMQQDVLAEMRTKRGADFGDEIRLPFLVKHYAYLRYTAYLRARGFAQPVHPKPNVILYGQNKTNH